MKQSFLSMFRSTAESCSLQVKGAYNVHQVTRWLVITQPLSITMTLRRNSIQLLYFVRNVYFSKVNLSCCFACEPKI